MPFGTLRWAVQPMMSLLRKTKNKAFSPRLLLYTNTAITVGLSIAGDIVQQLYQAKVNKKSVAWDRKRTLHMAVVGFVMSPFIHYWYIGAERWLPGRNFKVVCTKIFLDMTVASPVYLSIFMVSMGLMEGKSVAQWKADFTEKGPVLYAMELAVWPPALFVNFYFLPLKYRVVYDNTISFGFDFFWSYVWYEMFDKKGEKVSTSAKQLTSDSRRSPPQELSENTHVQTRDKASRVEDSEECAVDSA